MPCYRPLQGYRSKVVNPSGKRSIVFKASQGFVDMPVTVPCGSCVGCRLDRSRQWAVRCIHEASLYEKNCFLTLTFNQEHLPADMSLCVKTHQDFMKRLRFRCGSGIKFYMCGEYGSKFGRPHYHYLLFNHDFNDKELFRVTRRGERLYTSKVLEELWPFGYSTIGSVTFESAAYVARYIMKKITGDLADDHYRYIDPETGEIFDRKPEFNIPSNGLGKGWFEKFSSDVYPHDFVVLKGKKFKPPKYYDGLFEVEDPEGFQRMKGRRVRSSKARAEDNTPQRLAVREKVQLEKMSRLKRGIGDET